MSSVTFDLDHPLWDPNLFKLIWKACKTNDHIYWIRLHKYIKQKKAKRNEKIKRYLRKTTIYDYMPISQVVYLMSPGSDWHNQWFSHDVKTRIKIMNYFERCRLFSSKSLN